MNILCLSPHFPPNQYNYCRSLRAAGAHALGIGDPPFETLTAAQRDALTDYHRVENMDDYDAVYRAVAWFIHRHGRIDRVESHNEYWLPVDARLRADFNIPGDRLERLEVTRRKSRMKEVFSLAGVSVARGEKAATLDGALAFAARVGYPLVAKPDIGVGASLTWTIDSDDEMRTFFADKGDAEYFLEEFIRGTIVTFDGLADAEGNILGEFSLEYSRGVMEIVNEDTDMYYFTHRTIPPDLREAGERSVRAFNIRGRFFHIEFFRTDPGEEIVALEANLRPPGGFTVDMYNYAAEIDLYASWARMITGRPARCPQERPWHCCFVNRKSRYAYLHAHGEIVSRYGSRIVSHTPMPEVFRAAMGDYAYLLRTETLEEMRRIVGFVQAKEKG